MKNFLHTKSAVFLLGAALAFGAATARADDDQPVVKQHHVKSTHTGKRIPKRDQITAEHPGTVVKGSNIIPTRDDRNSQEVNGTQVGGAHGPEYRVPTGSNLPQRYRREGYTTNSKENSYIMDKNDQSLRSHNNVSSALRDVPGVSVSGPRGL